LKPASSLIWISGAAIRCDGTRGKAVVERITKQGGQTRFLAADFSPLSGVRSLADGDVAGANPQASDEDARRRLRSLSFDLVGIANPLAARG
jgi:hypothetical protein